MEENPTYAVIVPMENIKSSLEIDSDTEIAFVQDKDGNGATIMTKGAVAVDFNGRRYCKPSEFPMALRHAIHNGTLDKAEAVSDENWFEIFPLHDGWMADTGSEVVDIEGMTTDQITTVLDEFCQRKGL